MKTNEVAILNALQSAAIILDENGDIAFANRRWNRNTGSFSLSGDKFQPSNFIEHCKVAINEGNDYALRLLFGIREVLNGTKEEFKITIKFASARANRWYKTEVSPIQLNSQKHLLLVFNPASENIKTIHRLRESEALYRQNFKYSTAGIIFGKSSGEILDVNPAACKMLGYTESELMEGGRSMIVDVDDPAHKEVVRIRNEKSVFRGEKEYKHKDGHYIPVQLTSVKYSSDDNEQHIINTFRSLQHEKTSQYTLEEERRFTKTNLS
ncbi:MAG: PAS domain S-box protein [Balneolaceae bacterium]|nr:PAS domain S-box protein [Balneolaceae bacterium]